MKIEDVQKLTRGAAAMLLCALLVLCSCSKDKDELAMQLLSTVPSSAGVVAVADCGQMIDKAGGADVVTSVLARQFPDPSTSRVLDAVAKSWNPECAVIFSDGYYIYLTARLDNPVELEKTLSTDPRLKLNESNGIKAGPNVAVSGDQVWVLLSKGTIDPLNVKGYTSLSEVRSFASSQYAKKLADSDKDIEFVGDLNALLSQMGGSFKDSAMVRMALSTLFKDAAYIAGDVVFDKGKELVDVNVLDSKYNQAEYLLPTAKINTALIDSVATEAVTVAALNAPKSLIGRIKDIGASMGGALPRELLDMLNPIDGTMAFAVGKDDQSLRGIISVHGEDTGSLGSAMAGLKLNTERVGDKFIVSEGGNVNGPLKVASVSPLFKGAVAGAVTADVKGANDGTKAIKMAAIMLYYERKGLELMVTIYTANDSEYSLKTLFKAADRK